MDDDERQALQAEGLDPDDPAVIAAIDLCPMGTVAGSGPAKLLATQVAEVSVRGPGYNVAVAELRRDDFPNNFAGGLVALQAQSTGEAIALSVADVEFLKRRSSVRRNAVQVGQDFEVGQTKGI